MVTKQNGLVMSLLKCLFQLAQGSIAEREFGNPWLLHGSRGALKAAFNPNSALLLARDCLAGTPLLTHRKRERLETCL